MVVSCTEAELEEGLAHARCSYALPLHADTLRTLFNQIMLKLGPGEKFGCIAAKAVRAIGIRGKFFRPYMSALGIMGNYRKKHPQLVITSDQGPMTDDELAREVDDFMLPADCLPIELNTVSYLSRVA